MTAKKWYRVDVSVVNVEENRTEWREIGIAYGVSAASRLRKKYRRYLTRRVEIDAPEWSRPTPAAADAPNGAPLT